MLKEFLPPPLTEPLMNVNDPVESASEPLPGAYYGLRQLRHGVGRQLSKGRQPLELPNDF